VTQSDSYWNDRLVNYNMLARGIEINDKHSAIVESLSSNSYARMEAFAYMADTLEEIAKRFEEQA